MFNRAAILALTVGGCAAGPPPSTPSSNQVSTEPAASGAAASRTSSASPLASPDDVVRGQRVALDPCYAIARAADPSLGRTSVEMALVIDAEGKPLTVDLQYRHRISEKAKECMRDAALGLRFSPSMQGRRTVVVAFPAPQP